MKKLAFAVLMAATSATYACNLKVSDPPLVQEVMRQNGGYHISEEKCKFLNEQGLAISVQGNAAVRGGVSIAWAAVSVANLPMGVVSDSYRFTDVVDARQASQPVANKMLYDAVSDALSKLDVYAAAKEVRSYMAVRK